MPPLLLSFFFCYCPEESVSQWQFWDGTCPKEEQVNQRIDESHGRKLMRADTAQSRISELEGAIELYLTNLPDLQVNQAQDVNWSEVRAAVQLEHTVYSHRWFVASMCSNQIVGSLCWPMVPGHFWISPMPVVTSWVCELSHGFFSASFPKWSRLWIV